MNVHDFSHFVCIKKIYISIFHDVRQRFLHFFTGCLCLTQEASLSLSGPGAGRVDFRHTVPRSDIISYCLCWFHFRLFQVIVTSFDALLNGMQMYAECFFWGHQLQVFYGGLVQRRQVVLLTSNDPAGPDALPRALADRLDGSEQLRRFTREIEAIKTVLTITESHIRIVILSYSFHIDNI